MTPEELWNKWQVMCLLLKEKLLSQKVDHFYAALVPLAIDTKSQTIYLTGRYIGNAGFYQNLLNQDAATLRDVIISVFGKPYVLIVLDKNKEETSNYREGDSKKGNHDRTYNKLILRKVQEIHHLKRELRAADVMIETLIKLLKQMGE